VGECPLSGRRTAGKREKGGRKRVPASFEFHFTLHNHSLYLGANCLREKEGGRKKGKKKRKDELAIEYLFSLFLYLSFFTWGGGGGGYNRGRNERKGGKKGGTRSYRQGGGCTLIPICFFSALSFPSSKTIREEK